MKNDEILSENEPKLQVGRLLRIAAAHEGAFTNS